MRVMRYLPVVLKCRIPSGLISPANQIHISAIPSHTEGRLAIVTNAERGVVDADGAFDEGAGGVRRNRMVLTPRRWRQVCERQLSQATVTKKPDRRGEHEGNR